MPHIIIKLCGGRSPEIKAQLSEAIVEAVVRTVGSKPGNISIAMEHVPVELWPEMYRRDILNCDVELVKSPTYNPFD